MAWITDPAGRVSDGDFTAALEKRYSGRGPAAAAVPDFAERYGNVCDLVVQLLWPEKYGTAPDDAASHTSHPARQIARLIFAAAMLEPDTAAATNRQAEDARPSLMSDG